jgi:hypothetical protein
MLSRHDVLAVAVDPWDIHFVERSQYYRRLDVRQSDGGRGDSNPGRRSRNAFRTSVRGRDRLLDRSGRWRIGFTRVDYDRRERRGHRDLDPRRYGSGLHAHRGDNRSVGHVAGDGEGWGRGCLYEGQSRHTRRCGGGEHPHHGSRRRQVRQSCGGSRRRVDDDRRRFDRCDDDDRCERQCGGRVLERPVTAKLRHHRDGGRSRGDNVHGRRAVRGILYDGCTSAGPDRRGLSSRTPDDDASTFLGCM